MSKHKVTEQGKEDIWLIVEDKVYDVSALI